MGLFGPDSQRLENKQERQAKKLESKQEKLQKKTANLEQFKKTKEATDQSLAGAKAKEAEEKQNEEAAMVGNMIELGNYADAVDDLLNIKQFANDGGVKTEGEFGVEKGEGKLKATIQDRIEQNQALDQATPEQLKKLLETVNNKMMEGRKQLMQEYTNNPDIRIKDMQKVEKRYNKLRRQIQARIDNPGEQVA